MLIANAKIAPQGSVFFCLWETVTIFRDFQHKPLDLLSSLGREGKLKKYAAQNFILPAGGSLGWYLVLQLGGTWTGVNPRSSTLRRGTGWIHKSFHHIMRCHHGGFCTNRVTENYYILVNFAGNPLKCQPYKKKPPESYSFFKVIPFLGIIAHPQKVTSMLPHFQDLKLSLSLFNDGILVTPKK